jgi:hypothetical protein
MYDTLFNLKCSFSFESRCVKVHPYTIHIPLSTPGFFVISKEDFLMKYKKSIWSLEISCTSLSWPVGALLERLTTNAVVATVLGSIPASSDTVESEGHEAVLNIVHKKKKSKKFPFKKSCVITDREKNSKSSRTQNLSYIYLGSSVCHIPVCHPVILSSCHPVILSQLRNALLFF